MKKYNYMAHSHLSNGIMGAHRGGLGYTHKCIIETVGWFGILTDYCNIFILIL
jgi:hypothetical protein